MDVIGTAAGWRTHLGAARAAGRTVGLVPTMGALHQGHISLITRAAADNDVVAVSIFVNPLQFGDPEDIAHYPRTLDTDLAKSADAGAHVVFAPAVTEMYPTWPNPPATTVTVRGLTDRWEGASRPGHFDGVATVVAKLFAAAGPCRSYFGLKDFQQLAVVRRMASDLCLPVDVVGCPVVREPDGLALSSRNVHLSATEREQATALSRALTAAAGAASAGATLDDVRATALAELRAARIEPEYVALVDPETFGPPNGRVLIAVAARVGSTRLIDNTLITAGRP